MQKASSAQVGYLAILLAGLLLCLGVRFEANRQYLVAWQQYLESRQVDSKDYTKRVSSFFSALNDNLGTLSFLPSVRNDIDLAWPGSIIGQSGDGRETIQQVYNNLAKNALPSQSFTSSLWISIPKHLDLATGKL